MTSEEFAQKINEWARGTMIENHGTRFLSAGEGRAHTQLAFKPSLTQLTGLFHAGAIIALADETATAAAMWETNPIGEFRPELFPLTLQLREGQQALHYLKRTMKYPTLDVPPSGGGLVTVSIFHFSAAKKRSLVATAEIAEISAAR